MKEICCPSELSPTLVVTGEHYQIQQQRDEEHSKDGLALFGVHDGCEVGECVDRIAREVMKRPAL